MNVIDKMERKINLLEETVEELRDALLRAEELLTEAELRNTQLVCQIDELHTRMRLGN